LLEFGGRGSHHRILRQPPAAEHRTGTIVRLLSPWPRHYVKTSAQLVQGALLERLSQEGYSMHVEVHPGLYQRFSVKDCARLANLPDTAGWLLYYSTSQIQAWFANQRLPCVVLGRCHEGVRLANVEFDFRSSCRHAAGLFLARGHRELAFLAPTPMTGGDLSSAAGFCEGAEKGRPPGRVTVFNYDTTVQDLCRVLREAISRSPRPTAYLVGWPEHTFSVLGWFIQQGIKVPQDAAIISRSDDQYLSYAIPSVARYGIDSERMGRKAGELLLDQVRHGSGKIRTISIMPEFIPGETLGK
jgi:DNA-binding LacI/PurR family transcriptional regulator